MTFALQPTLFFCFAMTLAACSLVVDVDSFPVTEMDASMGGGGASDGLGDLDLPATVQPSDEPFPPSQPGPNAPMDADILNNPSTGDNAGPMTGGTASDGGSSEELPQMGSGPPASEPSGGGGSAASVDVDDARGGATDTAGAAAGDESAAAGGSEGPLAGSEGPGSAGPGSAGQGSQGGETGGSDPGTGGEG